MKNIKKTDLRVIKSKESIRESFLSLLIQKPISDISITEISEVANVNRKTFYANYKSINEIIDEFVDETVKQFKEMMQNSNISDDLKNPYVILEKLNELIYKNYVVFDYILRSDLSTLFIEKIISTLKDQITAIMNINFIGNHEKNDVIFSYVSGGIVFVYKNWFLSNRTQSLSDVSKSLVSIMTYGLKHYEQI